MNPWRVRRLLLSVLVPALLAAAGAVHAARVWTDGDGDGLPDVSTIQTTVRSLITVDVWIHSEAFAWTNFVVFVERSPTLVFASADYFISGGVNFPVDTFTNPGATGLAGIFYDNHGLDRIGSITVRPGLPGLGCLSPIIDPQNAYDTFSSLGTQLDYALFRTSDGSCYDATSTTASAEITWGRLKGLYR